MDLLEILKYELSELKLTDKFQIARYIYIRTGELFNYDPLYEILDCNDQEEKFELINKRVDIHNVTDINIVCYSWANMYKDLLSEFGINAKVIESPFHSHVIFSINNKKYTADLMRDYQDLYLTKLGMPTKYFNRLMVSEEESAAELNKVDNKIKYRKTINTEDVLRQIKQELNNNYKDHDDYMYNVFKTVSNIMNFHRKNIGYISGRLYIKHLLMYFLDDSYKPCSARIYDKETNTYIQAYSVESKNKRHYFIYQQINNNYYEMNEVNKETVEYLVESKNYKTKYTKNLHLVT